MSRRSIDGRTYYVFQDRLKDIVKRAGESISCDEIERALRASPGIADIAVVPVPDEVYLEKACACIVLLPGAEPPSVTSLGQILGQAGLAKFKWPEHVQIFDAFPTTASGKLSKPLLKEEAAARIRGAT